MNAMIDAIGAIAIVNTTHTTVTETGELTEIILSRAGSHVVDETAKHFMGATTGAWHVSARMGVLPGRYATRQHLRRHAFPCTHAPIEAYMTTTDSMVSFCCLARGQELTRAIGHIRRFIQ